MAWSVWVCAHSDCGFPKIKKKRRRRLREEGGSRPPYLPNPFMHTNFFDNSTGKLAQGEVKENIFNWQKK